MPPGQQDQAEAVPQPPQVCPHPGCGAHGWSETLQLSLSSPCPRSAGVRGPERLRRCRWVPAARGSACPLPQRGVILPAARPRGAGMFSCLCVYPGPGWSFPGISRVSSSYCRWPGLTAHPPGWRVWERTPPQSHGCPERGKCRPARLAPSCPLKEHPLAPACFPGGK